MDRREAVVDSTALRARILAVDDSAETRELFQASLEAAGYQVLAVSSGEEALTAVAAQPPDLILLDVMMPGVDGFEVCRRLKSDEETALIPIVILTALHQFEHRLRGIELGADDFLTKPFNRLELLTRVRSLLRAKGIHDQTAVYNRLLEEKVAERTAALKRALDDLREMDRLKSEFLANISHELLTPLTPIRGYVPALLQEMFGCVTPKQRQVLEIMARCGDRLHRLLDDLLTFMQWESGHGVVRLKPVEVPAVVDTATAGLTTVAREKGVHLVSEVAPDVPRIQADRLALSRALGHLLENAVKFTPKGGRASITARRIKRSCGELIAGPDGGEPLGLHRTEEWGEFVEIAVQDTGVGIPPEAIQKIFDRFYQVDSSTTRQHGGTGLGLALVKRILEAHKAFIALESLPGKGTTVSICLPAAA